MWDAPSPLAMKVSYRPVFIIRKFNKELCWAVPLTTKIKDHPHYYQFIFEDNCPRCVMLTQLKATDARRFTNKIGRIAEGEFFEIK